jgi:acyl dehydratase
MNIEAKEGTKFSHVFSFTQENVEDFAKVTGDDNPLHLDAEYAATTQFKKPIIHGMLGASVFTKILGTQFPGHGSVYLGQTMEFLRPMFVDNEYEAIFTIKSIDSARHRAEISTEVFDLKTKKVTIRGAATLMNDKVF